MSAISLEKKIIFIHIPKTGGTSMEGRGFLQPVITRHFALFDYQTMYGPLGYKLDDFFKFAFARNPYDRLASAIINNMRDGKEKIDMPVSDFVLKYQAMLPLWIATKPMFTFVCLDGKLAVDFVGRFENLDEDWKSVCKTMGVVDTLPHINKGKHEGSYRDLYNKEAKFVVEKLYAKDFEMFNYEL